MERRRVSTETQWEVAYGYSRAVRVGDLVFVAGTVAVDEQGSVRGEGDAYQQAKFVFEKIERALREVGASLDDAVRTRMYVTDMSFADDVGRAHMEKVGTAKPAATMVEVKALARPTVLVEIEVDAVVDSAY